MPGINGIEPGTANVIDKVLKHLGLDPSSSVLLFIPLDHSGEHVVYSNFSAPPTGLEVSYGALDDVCVPSVAG
jgi:hypothetical protein